MVMAAPELKPGPIDHALALAKRGYRVLPIRPGKKHPAVLAWQNAATTSPDIIDSWWNGLYREHGVGIATGHMEGGKAFFVLDVDDRPEFSGSDALAELEATHGKLPDTVRSITGSNGSHVFLAVPDGRQCPRNDQAAKIAVGLDIRGEGGQVVVAPTVHPNGNTYQWEHGHAPGQVPLADAPMWLMDLLEPAPAPPPRQPSPPSPSRAVDPFMRATASPAERYNDSTTWPELLTDDGWTLSHVRDGEQYWTRPGKDTREGTSATVGWNGIDALKVFSSSPEIGWLEEDGVYSRFQYYARRHHRGDESAAARAVIASEAPPAPARLPVVPVGPMAPVGAPAPVELVADDAVDPYDAELLGMLVEWPAFWQREGAEAQWMMEPVLAEGRAHAIYAPGGTGKSLFSLWLAAALASGRQGLDGHPVTPRRVLYLDYEMTPEDVRERLEAMGYDATCDLSNLHYAILPSLPPADAPEGGKAIARMAQLVDAELVILDTFSRAVSGDENDADTVRAFYRWTLLHLKSEGRSFCRVDHAGKDLDRGQRGSSAKNDDVDVVWQMTKADGGFKLLAKKRRMGWVPEEVALLQYDSPSLHYRVVTDVPPEGTAGVIADLDELNIPPSVGYRKAALDLKEAGKPARGQLIREAQKQRKKRLFPVDNSRDAFGTHPADGGLGRIRDAPSENSHSPGTDSSGTHADAVADATGDACVPRSEDAVRPACAEPAPIDDIPPPW